MTENILTVITLVVCLGLYLTFVYFVLRIIWIIITSLLTVITPNQAREFIEKLINLNNIEKDKDKIKEILMFEYKYHDLDTYKDIENKFKELTSEVKQ